MPHQVTPETPHSFERCQEAIVPMAEVLSRISSKWTIFVVMNLSAGPRRFSDLKRTIVGISQKMLTVTLRDLERDGFVTRTVTPTIPPRVDYELTAMGRELREPLRTIGDWAEANRARVEAARSRYQERESA